MAEEIAFENGWISNFQGLVTLTLTLDRIIPSCINHQPLPTCQIFIEIKETFCGLTDLRTDGWTFHIHFIRLTQKNLTNSVKNARKYKKYKKRM